MFSIFFRFFYFFIFLESQVVFICLRYIIFFLFDIPDFMQIYAQLF